MKFLQKKCSYYLKTLDYHKYEVHIQSKRKDAVPSSFESIHLTFVVDKNDPREKIEKAIQLSLDKYCSVSKTLELAGANISYKVTVNE